MLWLFLVKIKFKKKEREKQSVTNDEPQKKRKKIIMKKGNSDKENVDEGSISRTMTKPMKTHYHC